MSTVLHATICFPVDGRRVLLGMKKRRMGAGWWNGFGGGIEQDETPLRAAVRELFEESGLVAREADLTQTAEILFHLPESKQLNAFVFVASKWRGVPQETEEMSPSWFAFDEVPYDDMWPADRIWLPQILSGKRLTGEVRFGASVHEVQHAVFTERTDL